MHQDIHKYTTTHRNELMHVMSQKPAQLSDTPEAANVDELFRQVAHTFEGGRELIRKCYQSLLMHFSAGQKVLDLGCGSGVFLEELARRGVYGTGIEIDKQRVAECLARGLTVYRQRFQDFVANTSELFDGIVLMHVIEHMEGEEAFKLLIQSVRLLRPNGKLIIVTPNYSHGSVSSDNFWLDITHKRPYPLALLQAMLQTIGLEVIEAGVARWNIIDLLAIGCKSEHTEAHYESAFDCLSIGGRAGKQLALNHPVGFCLKNGRPILVRCSERIVEVPFVHGSLPYPFRGRTIDIGCCESQLAFEAACLGFESWAIDIRLPLIKFPGVCYIQADICHNPFPSDYFDVAIACSTVEHVGLAVYKNNRYEPKGDLLALKAIHRIVKPGGQLILTVPFGLRATTDWYRVYDRDSLHRLLSDTLFYVEREDYWSQEELNWMPVSSGAAERIDSVSTGVQAVACVLARRR